MFMRYEIAATLCALLLLCAALQIYVVHLRGITMKSAQTVYLGMGVCVLIALLFVGRAYEVGPTGVASMLDIAAMTALAVANGLALLALLRTRA